MPDTFPTCRIKPTSLRCHHQSAPVGLNTRTPFLSWALEALDPVCGGQMQSAWRIVAGDNRDDVANGVGNAWDSGKQEGGETLVYWNGQALASDQILWWSVQVWDEAGTASGLSEPYSILTGLDGDNWSAEWIARYFVLPAGRETPQDNVYDNRFQARPADYLRREVVLTERPVRATVYLSALGLYEFYLNGKQVGCDMMAPGWTDYHQRVEYQAHDVTEHFVEGANCIGAIIGEGWYSGRVGHNQRRAGNHYGGRPAFLCQIHLEYADGRLEKIVTDDNWHTRQGPICYSDFLAGEMYDARLELKDWCLPGHDVSRWQPVEQVDLEPKAPQLDAARSQPVRAVMELAPVSVTELAPTRHIYDFGQNLAGVVELTVRAPAGTEFRLRHGERLDEQGALYTANLRYAVSEDIYIAKGEGVEIFRPRFTFHGFQYVELTASAECDVAPDLKAVAIHSDLPMTGEIETGNEMVNQLLSNILWSQRGNFLSVPTDCPQRDERYGWSADAQVFWKTAGYFMDTSAFLAKWMEDLIDGQSPEGAFPDVAPTKPLNPYRLTPQPGAPAWGDAPIILGWHHHLRYNDRALLERCWQPFVQWMDYIERHNPDGIRRNQVNNNYGDWLSVGPETDRDLINTAYWIYVADLMTGIAEALKKETDRWSALAQCLRRTFAEQFIQPDGTLSGDTQTAYLLALDFDILPEAKQSVAVDRLVELIREAGGHLQTGFLGVRHLCPALANHGHEDLAVSLLLNETYPSWGFSIRHGATSIWERWDGWTKENGFQSTAMNSFNHYAYGAVGEWIWSRLAAIDWCDDAPGFKRVRMRPIFDRRIGWVNAAYEAHTGRIESRWRYQEDDCVIWEILIPPGVAAEISLPSDMKCDLGDAFELKSGSHSINVRPS